MPGVYLLRTVRLPSAPTKEGFLVRCVRLGWADVLVDVLPWSSRGWLALVSAGVGWANCEPEFGA